MASYKDYKSISAAKKAGSIYYMNKQGKKMLAVTKEDLDAWKKRNKGKYKGSALTAWANNKGKDISGAPKSSMKPRLRPGSTKSVPDPKETKEVKAANKEMSVRDIKNVAEGALTRAEAARRTYEYNKKQRQSERPKGGGQKFREWYDKNGSKYDTMKEAMAAFQKSLKSGNSKGGLQKKKKGYAKGGMIDYRKKGMFYGGMTKRGKK
jgi:hypothetical protein